jgi:hypothetical protein
MDDSYGHVEVCHERLLAALPKFITLWSGRSPNLARKVVDLPQVG